MNKCPCKSIVLIGAGNVATQLGKSLQKQGFSIVQVYSRTETSASALAQRLNTQYTTNTSLIISDADVYVFSIKDDEIANVLATIPIGKGLYVHTAGSVDMDVFSPYTDRYGVLYPLQTFSKNRDVSFERIPILLEANQKEDADVLLYIAGQLSNTVQILSSEKRRYIHLAAVFACNFTNHMYSLAADILEKQDIDYSLLLPLVEETAAKIKDLPPIKAQTGPAIRYDKEVMQKHLDLLGKDADSKEIYQGISHSIRNFHKNRTQQ